MNSRLLRLKKLQKLIAKQKLDAALITNPYDISYFTGFSNFSTEEREGYLLVTEKKAYIITDGRYDEAVKKQTSGFEVLVRSAGNSAYTIFSKLAKKHTLVTVGFDEHNLTVAEYVKLWDVFQKLIPFSAKELRVKKDSKEIEMIKKACRLGDKAYTFIQTKLRTSITEKQLATELEFFIKQEGADLSFPTIVAFGKNASVPHHQTSDKQLKTNDFVLLDFGVKFENYCSDMTRTLVFGKASEKQKKMYQTVLGAQQAAIDYIESIYSSTKSGGRVEKQDSSRLANTRSNNNILVSEIDKTARDYIISKRYPTIPHSLGHGIGLEVHEAPSLSPTPKEILEEGMVFSIEPGIYIPDFGGVRIEDLFAILDGKLVQLTKSSKNLTEM